MEREWGYSKEVKSSLWWGCRAIVNSKGLELLYDRQSFDGDRNDPDKEAFFEWINKVVIGFIESEIKKGRTCGSFEGNGFKCDWVARGGYCYIGCYRIELEGDEER